MMLFAPPFSERRSCGRGACGQETGPQRKEIMVGEKSKKRALRHCRKRHNVAKALGKCPHCPRGAFCALLKKTRARNALGAGGPAPRRRRALREDGDGHRRVRRAIHSGRGCHCRRPGRIGPMDKFGFARSMPKKRPLARQFGARRLLRDNRKRDAL